MGGLLHFIAVAAVVKLGGGGKEEGMGCSCASRRRFMQCLLSENGSPKSSSSKRDEWKRKGAGCSPMAGLSLLVVRRWRPSWLLRSLFEGIL